MGLWIDIKKGFGSQLIEWGSRLDPEFIPEIVEHFTKKEKTE